MFKKIILWNRKFVVFPLFELGKRAVVANRPLIYFADHFLCVSRNDMDLDPFFHGNANKICGEKNFYIFQL